MNTDRVLRCVLATAFVVLSGTAAAAPSDDRAAAPTVVLDTMGFWRMHHELAPPVIRVGGQLKPALLPQSWMNNRTDAAPTGWQQPDFDDGAWFRGPALRSIKSPWLGRLCLRGKFEVADPAKAANLRLSVDFHGGIVVYVNGCELTRRHLPSGPLGPDTLADPYPAEAFVDEAGLMLFPGNVRWHHPSAKDFWRNRTVSAEATRRMGLQRRSLQDVAIPASMLRRGVNVLAVELVRSEYDQSVEEARQAFKTAHEQYAYQVFFATCELERIRLTSSDGAAVVSNARRAEGLQVWNSLPASTDFDLDFGDPCEPLRPIELLGPRNGPVSGKVVVGDTRPLVGLRATVGDLRSEHGGIIPAARVQLRYGLPWDDEQIVESQRAAARPYPHPTTPLSCLSDAPPAEVAVTTKDYPPYDPKPVKGAVASVWATVNIPADAPPGAYSGHITVSVEGREPVTAPLRVQVVEWVAPDPKEWTTWVDLVQSPDTLALEYELPMWSPQHWAMIGRSLSMLGQVGNRTLYLPLIANTNLGNEESLVRWIEKGPGRYEFDFANLDRYLDSALDHMGKPEVVIAVVWDLYMLDASGKLPEDEKYDEGRRIRQERMPANVLQQGGRVGLGPMVTVLDRASGATRRVELPAYSDPAAKAPWSSLLGALRERLAKRGLDGALMFGLNSDAWAPRPTVRFFNDILPGTPWVVQSHDGFPAGGKPLHGITPVGYQTRTWGVTFSDEDRHDPYRVNKAPGDAGSAGRMYGWKTPERIAIFERFNLNPFSYARWRYFAEVNITGGQRGVGRVGADLWPVIKDKSGRRVGSAHERYPESHWRNLTIRTSLLAPGTDGPAATSRFEAFREGLIDAEARIQIERALTDPASRKKLGDDFASRCQEHLDERLRLMFLAMSNFQMHAGGYDSGVQYATGWRFAPTVYGQTWYSASGWQQRNEQLYLLAAEVERRLADPAR